MTTESYALACSSAPLECGATCSGFDADLSRIRASCAAPGASAPARYLYAIGQCGSYHYIDTTYLWVSPVDLHLTRGEIAFYAASGPMVAQGVRSDVVWPGCPLPGQFSGLVPVCQMRQMETFQCR